MGSATDTGLTLTDIDLTYPDGDSVVRAVRGVSLHVEPGTTVALTGPSGCGKSSVLAVAGALIRPDSGTVRIGDRCLDGLDAEALARVRRERIGLIFQNDNLVPGLTAEEQLLLAAHVAGRRPSRHRAQARELLSAVGLDGAFGRRPGQLSGGMRQRVNIARALMNGPQVLLIDEPTSALDSTRGTQIVKLLTELARDRGIASLLVTHDLQTVTGVDGVLEMKDGALLAGVGV
ncbi:ABC transporter ATP-binding protein [Gordonia sihwensis]|uniref:ABC transporter ATP-binding protein n=1 Tax=Gordonia TaxID=2053 RepID=UPI0024180210|nr:ABC transporter ATP-binding protein [Gordonia sihwensis]WFN93785.1 ABC transporter ATP-binding protein [Gordonia sihwensis]